MPRIGFKNRRIKAIIFHQSTNHELDVPIIYNLNDGKHISIMPRAPRTNYRKKEKPHLRGYQKKHSNKKRSNQKESSKFASKKVDDGSSSSFYKSGEVCVQMQESLDLNNISKDGNEIMDLPVINAKELFSKLFDIKNENISSDDFFIDSDYEE